MGPRLFQAGILLIVLGFINALIMPFFTATRVGFSGSLDAIMNGTVLIVIGLVFPQIKLKKNTALAIFWLTLYGTYMNWITVVMTSYWRAESDILKTPVGNPAQVFFAWSGLISFVLAMIISFILIYMGIEKDRASKQSS